LCMSVTLTIQEIDFTIMFDHPANEQYSTRGIVLL
jgi:hypothetical protein